MNYLKDLSEEQLSRFLNEKQECDDQIQETQESFMEGAIELSEASEQICKIHKRLKEFLELLTETNE